MRISPRNSITALALGIAGSLAFASQAHAAAFQLKENSAKGLGRAFAGSISAPGDASVVATNPAAMRGLDGRQFQADLSLINFSAKFEGRADYLGGLGGQISGGNGGDAGATVPVPAAYFHTPIGEKAHFGMSLTAPFGFVTEYDRDWVGRYNGVKTDLKAIDLNFAFSYDVNPYVSFGAGVFVQHLSIELTNAIDFGTILYTGGAAALGFRPGNADGFATIEGSNNRVGFTIGTLLSPTENTHIGIAYRSKTKHDIDNGKAYFDVPSNAAAVLAQVRPGWFVDTTGRTTVELPATLTFSLTHKVNDRWTVMADLSRTAWAPAFDSVTIDFDSNQDDSVLEFGYDDSTFGSIGAEYRLSDKVTLRGGLAYDETPTSYQHRDVRVPDQTRKWLSLGVTWTPSEKLEYNVGFTHLFVKDSHIDTTSATANRIRGSYDVRGDILAASVNYKF